MSKINNKKMTIIILIVLVVILIIINLVLYRQSSNVSTNENTNNEQSSNEGKLSADEFKKAFYNNFLIAYLIEGDVQTGSGTLKNTQDDETYYSVTDYLLEDIHSLEDINKLIDDNINIYAAIRVRKIMESSYANKYTSSNNKLYVKKSNNPCFRLKENIDLSHVEYIQRDGMDMVVYENVPYAFVIDNGKPKAPVLLFTCIIDFGRIGIDKEDVFDPKKWEFLTPNS